MEIRYCDICGKECRGTKDYFLNMTDKENKPHMTEVELCGICAEYFRKYIKTDTCREDIVKWYEGYGKEA